MKVWIILVEYLSQQHLHDIKLQLENGREQISYIIQQKPLIGQEKWNTFPRRNKTCTHESKIMTINCHGIKTYSYVKTLKMM